MRLGTKLTSIRIPLNTERGYHIALRASSMQPSRSIMGCERKFITTPMEGGLYITGTVEIGGLNAAPDYRHARILIRRGQQLFPGLDFTDDSQWIGRRPSLPDNLPVIDHLERYRNMFSAFRHGHSGMTGTPGATRFITDLVSGHTPFTDGRPYGL